MLPPESPKEFMDWIVDPLKGDDESFMFVLVPAEVCACVYVQDEKGRFSLMSLIDSNESFFFFFSCR